MCPWTPQSAPSSLQGLSSLLVSVWLAAVVSYMTGNTATEKHVVWYFGSVTGVHFITWMSQTILFFCFCPKVVPCNLLFIYPLYIFFKDCFVPNHEYVCVIMCCVCGVLRGQRPWSVTDDLACSLGLELWSSERGICARKRWAVSPAPYSC